MTDLIAEIKSKIDRPALIAWAKANRPPKDIYKHAFWEIAAIFNKLERTQSPITAPDERKVREGVLKLRKMGYSDQLKALWPQLFHHTPNVAKLLISSTIEMIRDFDRKVAKAVKKDVEVTLRVNDFRYLGDLVSMMIYHWELGDPYAEMKQDFARSLLAASPGAFLNLYSSVGMEFFRRAVAHRGIQFEGLFAGQPQFEVFSEVVGRVAQALTLLRLNRANVALTLDEALKPLSLQGRECELKTFFEQAFHQMPELVTIFVEVLEHITGFDFPPTLLEDLFPNMKIEQALQLEFSKMMGEMTVGDRVSCLMNLINLSGEEEDKFTPEQIATVSDLMGRGSAPQGPKRIGRGPGNLGSE